MTAAELAASDPGTPLPEQDLRIVNHNAPGSTAYRFLAPGILLTGEVTVTVQGSWWHAEQTVDGVTYAVDGDDELGVILALIAKRQGLAAVFGPDDGQTPPAAPGDPISAIMFTAVSQAAARAGRFLSLTDRRSITEQVSADLRDAGVIA